MSRDDRLPRHRHPRGQHRPAQNPIWAEKLALRNGPGGERRPAAVKTGTANDARDLVDVRLPRAAEEPKERRRWAVGVWMGNSDHSMPRTREAGDLADRGRAAVAVVRAPAHRRRPGRRLPRSPRASSRRGSTRGPAASPARGPARHERELFRAGTQPGAQARGRPGRAALLAGRAARGSWTRVKAELGPAALGRRRRRTGWRAPVAASGVTGQLDSRTAYFWDRSGWGGRLAGPCYVPRPTVRDDKAKGKGKGDKPGKGDDKPKDPGKPKPPDPACAVAVAPRRPGPPRDARRLRVRRKASHPPGAMRAARPGLRWTGQQVHVVCPTARRRDPGPAGLTGSPNVHEVHPCARPLSPSRLGLTALAAAACGNSGATNRPRRQRGPAREHGRAREPERDAREPERVAGQLLGTSQPTTPESARTPAFACPGARRQERVPEPPCPRHRRPPLG